MNELARLAAEIAARDWTAHAACRGVDPELFFSTRGYNEGMKAAKAVCAGCPVRVECLEYALDGSEKFGVWGGFSERQRRRMRRRPRPVAEHGSVARYGRGCRCEPCQAAKSRYNRLHRQSRAT